MGVQSLIRSGIVNSARYRSLLAGNEKFSPFGFELISTTILGTAAASVTFSNLGDYASKYKHLQIRSTGLWTTSGAETMRMRLNGDTGSNYNDHRLVGNGSSVFSSAGTNTTGMYAGFIPSSQFGASVIDILDAYSTTKNKTIRTFVGAVSAVNEIQIASGAFRNTASITSITILVASGNIATGSRFSLYGIKG